MDDRRFDALARSLAAPRSRRGLLGGIGALAAGLVGSRAGAQVAQAQCGNVVCYDRAARTQTVACNPGCVCCVYGNGNSRCRPPGECTGTVVSPTTTAAPTTTTTAAPTTAAPTTPAPTTTTPAPTTTTAAPTTPPPATTTTTTSTTTAAPATTTTTAPTTTTTTTAAPCGGTCLPSWEACIDGACCARGLYFCDSLADCCFGDLPGAVCGVIPGWDPHPVCYLELGAVGCHVDPGNNPYNCLPSRDPDDPDHVISVLCSPSGVCGGEGAVCQHNVTCASGVCCNAQCADLASDPNNCGNCGNACSEGGVCVDGRCFS